MQLLSFQHKFIWCFTTALNISGFWIPDTLLTRMFLLLSFSLDLGNIRKQRRRRRRRRKKKKRRRKRSRRRRRKKSWKRPGGGERERLWLLFVDCMQSLRCHEGSRGYQLACVPQQLAHGLCFVLSSHRPTSWCTTRIKKRQGRGQGQHKTSS